MHSVFGLIRVQKTLLAIIVSCLLGSVAQGQLAFDNLTKEDIENINREFSSLFSFTSVSAPSSLGSIFGFEIGMVGGLAQSPQIEKLAKQADASADVPAALPHGWLLGAITVPFGITGEINFIPELTLGDGSFQHTGFAAKWTVTDVFPLPIPLAVAVKASHSTSQFSFSQEIPGGDADVSYKNSMTGIGVQAGLKLLLIEPYVGVGYVNSSGELGSSGSSIFAPSFSADDQEKVKTSSQIYTLGVQANLLLLRVGLEYQNAFETDRLTAKVSLKF